MLSEAPDGYYAELAGARVANPAPPPHRTRRRSRSSHRRASRSIAYHWNRSGAPRDRHERDAAARELAALTRELPTAASVSRFCSRPTATSRRTVARCALQRLGSTLDCRRRSPPTSIHAPTGRASPPPPTRTRLDPYVVLALMRQESLFDPERGFAGRRLRPDAAPRDDGIARRRPARSTRTALVDPDDQHQPRHALSPRSCSIASTATSPRRSPPTTAARTRSPSGSAARPGAATDEFVETISYRETRHYVKQVLGNYRRYRRLYGAPGEQRALDRAAAPTATTRRQRERREQLAGEPAESAVRHQHDDVARRHLTRHQRRDRVGILAGLRARHRARRATAISPSGEQALAPPATARADGSPRT